MNNKLNEEINIIKSKDDRLKSLIERVERLEEEKNNLLADIKEVFSEAKGLGYDPKIMRKILVAIILTIMSFSSVMADSKKEKMAKLDNDNYKYIPKDKLIPAHCINGIIEFLDGSFFCLNKKGKLTNKSFFEGEFEGTYFYLNGNVFTGKFFKGKKLEGGMDRSNGTENVDCEGLKIFTCDTKKIQRYQKYFKSGDLFYDVNYWLH